MISLFDLIQISVGIRNYDFDYDFIVIVFIINYDSIVILDPLKRRRKRSGNKSCLPCCWRLPVVCVVLDTHNPPYYDYKCIIYINSKSTMHFIKVGKEGIVL